MSIESNNSREAYMEAYRILVSMLQHDEELFWKRNEVFLIVNGGLLTVLGFIGSSSVRFLSDVYFGLVISLVGFASCLVWLIVASRSESFYNLWHEQLENLEENHVAPINIFTISNSYFIGGEARLGKKILKPGRITQLMRIFVAIRIAIILFVVLWLVVILGLTGIL